MLTEICQYLRNWFERDIIVGNFQVLDGVLVATNNTTLPILSGQYYRIAGSIFNDGVHIMDEVTDVLKDEPVFSGAIWLMAIPPNFLALVEDIEEWTTKNVDAVNSPYQSESFGGYSYSLRSAGGATDGESGGVTWQNQFKARLSPWRKI